MDGSLIGECFVLQRELGGGAMGTVRLAEDKLLGRLVASVFGIGTRDFARGSEGLC